MKRQHTYQETGKPKPAGSRKKREWFWYVAIPMLLLIVMLLNTGSGSTKITWKQLDEDILSKKAVAKIEIVNKERAEIYIKPSFSEDSQFKEVFKRAMGKELNPGPHYFLIIGSVGTFERKLEQAEQHYRYGEHEMVPVDYIQQTGWFQNVGTGVLILVVMFVVWSFLLRRVSGAEGGSSVFNFSKSTATLIDKEQSKVTFDDVAGLDEAKVEVREIVEFLRAPATFTRLGAKIPKGVILVGPPGTGKTLLAKAVAGEAQVSFFSISGSEFVEMFVGVGASPVRDLFKQAKQKAPCIVFIDEIDAIGRSRGKGAMLSSGNDERESTLNQLLTEMDGFGTNSGVIVLAATNRADMLDAALLRPGRFDRHIYLELPNMKERRDIFSVHMKPLVTDETIDTGFLAAQTPGFSGADIANICNESALIAARRKKEKIGRQDFLDAIDRIIAGLEKKSKIISPGEKKVIAYHEAGHAVVSWLLPNVDAVVKVSIIPRGKSLGAAWYLPEEKQLRSISSFKEHLCSTLGGRAAEQVIFGEVSSGALDDLEKVTKEAYMMVAYYGFDEQLGNISFYDSTGRQDSSIQKPYSEATAAMIDEQVRQLVNTAYKQSVQILHSHQEQLRGVANLLLGKEVIFKEDLENILGARPCVSDSSNITPLQPENSLPNNSDQIIHPT